MTDNNKTLVSAGHELASELKADCGAVDVRSVANLLTELASALDVQSARSDALAAENAALKAVFNPEVIPEEAVEAFAETAIMDHDWNETSEWSWVENDTDVIRAVLEAIKPNTPATDAWVNEQRATGVEMFALMYAEEAIKSNNITTGWRAKASRAASEYAEQLRGGQA
ncbi:hypothetical protein [Atlantibacter hermannii]|uniref:hypothetical protein n=1 Tax=Atlantibacter hermannii TaxID=565 RepID=UPI0028AA8A5C|nr:hypothetical protein [Atlantibacter hermannii]